MTKVLVQGFGWMAIVQVLDWYSKAIVGRYVGMPCRSQHWLAALDMAVNRQFPNGVREHYLHSALGYKPPRQFEQEYHTSHRTQFTAA